MRNADEELQYDFLRIREEIGRYRRDKPDEEEIFPPLAPGVILKGDRDHPASS